MRIAVVSAIEAGSLEAHAINPVKMAAGFVELGHDVLLIVAFLETFDRHDYAAAEGTLREAIRLSPTWVTPRHHLAALQSIMGRDDDTLEGVVDRLLHGRGWRLALGEGSTGGLLAQRLTAAGARQFAGATVWPADAKPGDALERAGDLLLTLNADCALVLQANEAEHCTEAALKTPATEYTWQIGAFGRGQRNQLRTAIVALEQLRRHLSGVSLHF